jgi:hypothetical protein
LTIPSSVLRGAKFFFLTARFCLPVNRLARIRSLSDLSDCSSSAASQSASQHAGRLQSDSQATRSCSEGRCDGQVQPGHRHSRPRRPPRRCLSDLSASSAWLPPLCLSVCVVSSSHRVRQERSLHLQRMPETDCTGRTEVRGNRETRGGSSGRGGGRGGGAEGRRSARAESSTASINAA